MTLTQLRYLREIARQSHSISAAAAALRTSQPGISRQIQALEAELGIALLIRRRNRIAGLTDAGRNVVAIAERLLAEADSIRALAAELTGEGGTLTVATTHLHARYTLAGPVTAFSTAHPSVELRLLQTGPDEILKLVAGGESDIGISTESTDEHPSLTFLPGEAQRRSLILPVGHPLAGRSDVTLGDIARYPLVGYSAQSGNGAVTLRAFREAGIAPRFVVSATDSDVIKVYVAAGLGIGIVPDLALDDPVGERFERLDVTHLFPVARTTASIRRDTFLRNHVAQFIRSVAPAWNRRAILSAMKGAG